MVNFSYINVFFFLLPLFFYKFVYEFFYKKHNFNGIRRKYYRKDVTHMSYLDIEKIINGTPDKRIYNGYQLMKENYNEETALTFQKIYKVEPLSAILNNSSYIFSEGYHGLLFYKNLLESTCCFTKLPDEYNKFMEFYHTYEDQMDSEQKVHFESCGKQMLEDLTDSTKVLTLVATYIKENVDALFEDNLTRAIYNYKICKECGEPDEVEKSKNRVIGIFETAKEPCIILTYLPFVAREMALDSETAGPSSELNSFVLKEFVNTDMPYDQYVRAVTVMKRLQGNPYFEKAYSDYVINQDIMLWKNSLAMEHLQEKMSSLLTEAAAKEHISYNPVGERAVNALFDEVLEEALPSDTIATEISDIVTTTYEATTDLLSLEYYMNDDPNALADHYDLVSSGATIESALGEIIQMEEASPLFDTDGTDFFLDEAQRDAEEEASFPTLANSRSEKPEPKRPPQKPGFFRRMQTKFQDDKMDRMRKQSDKMRKKMDRDLAFQAAAEKPKEVIDNAKQKTQDLDDWDDQRRKNYMARPGYRKKIFKNLKLAILYGGTVATNAALLPFVMLARHFSKKKDARIRNELISEIETDIKVCDEKINDAQRDDSDAGRKKKYQLMRIRDELTRNLNRVKLNSKYI